HARMDRIEVDRHLSEISTAWTALFRAQQGVDSQAGLARAEVLERYGPAIHRYLLGATRDPDGADELHPQFALNFLKRDFRHADPNRGRFRDYLKTSLNHLVNQWRRGSRSRFQPLKDEVAVPVGESAAPVEDEDFVTIWREELIHRTWSALKER